MVGIPATSPKIWRPGNLPSLQEISTGAQVNWSPRLRNLLSPMPVLAHLPASSASEAGASYQGLPPPPL